MIVKEKDFFSFISNSLGYGDVVELFFVLIWVKTYMNANIIWFNSYANLN